MRVERSGNPGWCERLKGVEAGENQLAESVVTTGEGHGFAPAADHVKRVADSVRS